jgi:hypothetical protein
MTHSPATMATAPAISQTQRRAAAAAMRSIGIRRPAPDGEPHDTHGALPAPPPTPGKDLHKGGGQA